MRARSTCLCLLRHGLPPARASCRSSVSINIFLPSATVTAAGPMRIYRPLGGNWPAAWLARTRCGTAVVGVLSLPPPPSLRSGEVTCVCGGQTPLVRGADARCKSELDRDRLELDFESDKRRLCQRPLIRYLTDAQRCTCSQPTRSPPAPPNPAAPRTTACPPQRRARCAQRRAHSPNSEARRDLAQTLQVMQSEAKRPMKDLPDQGRPAKQSYGIAASTLYRNL